MTDDRNEEARTAMLEVIEKRKEGKKTPQYLATIAVTLSAFAFGTELAWTSPALPILTDSNSILSISKEEGSWISSILAIGAIIGALPAGYITDLYGRKLVGASLAIPFLISWLLIYFAKSVSYIYIGRFMAGIATGATSAICPMYIGEIAESSVRGSLGGYVQLMVTVGILYVNLLGAIESYDLLNLGCGLVPLVFLLAFINAPETPVYFLMKNRRHEAEKSLRKLRGSSYDIHAELNGIQNELSKNNENNTSVFAVLSQRATVKALICGLGLMLFQQFSGINAIIFYSVNIFKDAGSTFKPSSSAIIVAVVQTAVTYLSSLLVDRAGRKILLLISHSVMAICLGILGYFFYIKEKGEDVSSIGFIPLSSVVLFIIVFSLGAGPIPWLMVGELFTSEIKGLGTGLAVALNWISVFIVTKTFQTINDKFGQGVTFWYFSVVCVLGTLFVIFIVPETKGKSLEEIQIMLSGKKSSKHNQNNII